MNPSHSFQPAPTLISSSLPTVIHFNLDVQTRTKELIYVVLIQNTSTPMRLSLTKKVLQSLLHEMREQSYFMLGVLCTKKDLWITKEGPIPCTKSNLKFAEDEAFKAMAEPSNLPEHQGDLVASLKAVLEMKFAKVKTLPRSILLVGQGNVDYQQDIEKLMATSLDKHDSRISTIGIGNGTSDSFLRTIPLKGAGLFEIINDASDVERKIEIMMKRLRLPKISNIKLEWDKKSNIAYVLPYFKKDQSL